ncbi:MBOAT family O-acyltransferase [Thermodesulfobacteriota bacterium]
MLFNSFEFIFFFIAITAAYFLIPYRFRIWLLLAGSYYFYMRWKWNYIFLILAQTGINYYCGLKIGTSEVKKEKMFWLWTALTFSLGMLFFFKYYNFANDSAKAVFNAMGLSYLVPHLNIILPVGISFYTFQTLSYTIDVYRGRCEVEPHFGRFALFVSFFPQLVAGPIERANQLLVQFKRQNRFDLIRLTEGGKLIVWGMFKKVVIADRLAVYVDRVYAQPDLYSGASLAIATYFFAFQIYCDFSGYSDIAIGVARVLGYDIMQNFRLPYLATSIGDFWRRWHISLSTWFRDYLYIPLGGNRVGIEHWVFNIYIVFLLSGMWHGANWTFFAWGSLHGIFYLLEFGGKWFQKRFLPENPRFRTLMQPVRIFVTFHLVLLAWVFFRAGSLSDAGLIVSRIFTDFGGPFYLGASQLTTFLSICLIGLLVFVQISQKRGWISIYFSVPRMPYQIRWAGYLGMLIGIALLGKSSNEFIYFQF